MDKVEVEYQRELNNAAVVQANPGFYIIEDVGGVEAGDAGGGVLHCEKQGVFALSGSHKEGSRGRRNPL